MRSFVASCVRLPAAAVQDETLSLNVPLVIAAPISGATICAWSLKNRMAFVENDIT